MGAVLARPGRQVLAELRSKRRRRRMADFDFMDALYRAYVAAIFGGAALWWLALRLGGGAVASTTAHRAAVDGPQVVGLAIAMALAVGLRSGGRGGPIVLEAADVRHLLLAPLDRSLALRGPALRLLRFGATWGVGVGAVFGVLASRRLGGEWPAWAASGALVGASTVDGALGAAMAVSGARLGRRMAEWLALAVLAWSAADVVLAKATSPMSLIGQVALWPLRWRAGGLAGVAFAGLAVVSGVSLAGGTSVEASERRSSLAGQLRFAVTVRDLRSVILVRRQLAQDGARQRPWARLPGASSPLRAATNNPGHDPQRPRRKDGRRLALWRRGCHGLLRFRATRVARLALLGAVAGAAAVGAWRGTTPLVFAAGLALYIAGLDAVEPVAQSVDHPTLLDAYPLERGSALVGLLAAPTLVMLAVGVAGAATAVAVTEGSTTALTVAPVLLLPASLAGLAGAAISTVQGPPPLFSDSDLLLPPEAVGAKVFLRTLWPPLVSTAGMLPVLAARDASGSLVQSAVSAGVPVLVLVAGVLVWVRYRDRLHNAFQQAMAGTRPRA
ncbi:MAG: hypothetical protein ACLP7F_06000 [Acidimicrobiales bacterium]